MAPSSAYVSAPKKDSNPPTSQARNTSLAEPTAIIICAGTRKMPLPMMVPTTTAVAWLTPRSRASWGSRVFEFAGGIGGVAVYGKILELERHRDLQRTAKSLTTEGTEDHRGLRKS
jgi:hypothetical protein